ncbi:MAG: hypothetical protein ACK5L6_05125 [Anaerorhabdus sp.]|uniref:hypothetical protein n=1 Tax=Anaerorhabdus sp. TaxID=1872524 RepID=UPI003A835500
MNQEITSFHGWDKTLRLWNDSAELLVTTDIGPRILIYKTPSTDNVFRLFGDQLGSSGEDHFCIRGGHRFWLAPEDLVLSYHQDNTPVTWSEHTPSNELEIISVQQHPVPLRKTLGITLDPHTTRVSIRHTVTNEGDTPITLATWGLSVMKPGGLEIIPQPPLKEHSESDFLPNRGIVLWPYTDLSDPRWNFGQKFWTLRQADPGPPTKSGLAHREGWIAYVMDDSLFIKTISADPASTYPDGGCNFETFSDPTMLEIESLGPLGPLRPGASTSHQEHWHLFPLTEEIQIDSEEALAEWLAPFVRQTQTS